MCFLLVRALWQSWCLFFHLFWTSLPDWNLLINLLMKLTQSASVHRFNNHWWFPCCPWIKFNVFVLTLEDLYELAMNFGTQRPSDFCLLSPRAATCTLTFRFSLQFSLGPLPIPGIASSLPSIGPNSITAFRIEMLMLPSSSDYSTPHSSPL